jgi:hypothetical protein
VTTPPVPRIPKPTPVPGEQPLNLPRPTAAQIPVHIPPYHEEPPTVPLTQDPRV